MPPFVILGERDRAQRGSASRRTPIATFNLTLRFAAACLLLLASFCSAQSLVPLTTASHLQSPGWWPTRGTASPEEFAGSDSCARCHAAKFAAWQTTPMAHAASAPSIPQLTFDQPPYKYRLSNHTYTVTDGTNSISHQVSWAFGAGHVGQTYVYEDSGVFYETRLSYYTKINALDITTGHDRSAPASLAGAAGRRMSPAETRLCFGCHTTASTVSGRFDPAALTFGVTCEACHGPGASHVTAATAGLEQGSGRIFNPARLSPADSVDFCGACHRTLADVLENASPGMGTLTVRFQPFRLESSRCWTAGGKGDRRLTCVACHDPHQPLVRDSAAYDARCLACHVTRVAQPGAPLQPGFRLGATVCPVATTKCVTCHMPKEEVPDMHTSFTDHQIRIVRAAVRKK